jgi:hypothetical protein
LSAFVEGLGEHHCGTDFLSGRFLTHRKEAQRKIQSQDERFTHRNVIFVEHIVAKVVRKSRIEFHHM